jgi:hypothetical protein
MAQAHTRASHRRLASLRDVVPQAFDQENRANNSLTKQNYDQ